MKNFCNYFFSLILVFTQVESADVNVGEDAIGQPLIFINGEVEKGDLIKIKKASLKVLDDIFFGGLQYSVNSPGGDVLEAIKIGRYMRDVLAKVNTNGFIFYDYDSKDAEFQRKNLVENPEQKWKMLDSKIIDRNGKLKEEDLAKCYSSCVFIFFGAVERSLTDNYYKGDSRKQGGKRIPVMGIHRPYFEPEYFSNLSIKKAKEEYARLEKVTQNYLIEMGASSELISKIFQVSSNDLQLIHTADFKKFYRKKEPFIEEFLLAKCGASSEGKEVLSKEDNDYYEYMLFAKVSESLKRGYTLQKYSEYKKFYDSYEPAGYSNRKFKELQSKILKHNTYVENCNIKSLTDYQKSWFQTGG